MGSFRTLYVDMNSFFASVEQHLDPALRGRPLGITAMEEEVGICVAAYVEAKCFGVKTGTPVVEAKHLCPGIVFRPSRHRLYVGFNLRLTGLFDRYTEVERIRSVDEFQIGLSGQTSTLAGAKALVRVLKNAVAHEIGPTIRFSAGIGPNQLLAKIAGKLEKSDGRQWLSPDNMPERLAHMALDDLPGILWAMKARLKRAGVMDIASLYALDPRHACLIWHSVEGERFVRALQGEAITLLKTKRGGVGNSKVLAPEYRHPREAYLVNRWLIEKAAMRLRRAGMVAGHFQLHVSRYGARSLNTGMRCAASQDTRASFASIRNCGAASGRVSKASGWQPSVCTSAKRTTCVVDGDIFWLQGQKIRIADIDTPDLSKPGCRSEYNLGMNASYRLVELLNAGPFEVHTSGGREPTSMAMPCRVTARFQTMKRRHLPRAIPP